MRWGAFALALAAALVLDTSVLGQFPRTFGWLDLFLLLTLISAFCAPPREAVLAGWITGLVQDLASINPLCLHAFSLGLAALSVVWLRDHVNSAAWSAQVLLSVIAGLIAKITASVLAALSLRVWQRGVRVSLWDAPGGDFLSSLAMAVLLVLALQSPSWIMKRRIYRPYRRRW